MAIFWLLIKYLPQVIQLLTKLEEVAEDQIINYQVKRSNGKIELIFKREEGLSDAENARRLDDIFINRK